MTHVVKVNTTKLAHTRLGVQHTIMVHNGVTHPIIVHSGATHPIMVHSGPDTPQ